MDRYIENERTHLDSLRVKAGMLPAVKVVSTTIHAPSFEEMVLSQWSEEFETLMRNRLSMGALRYGLLGAPGKPTYDRETSMLKRIRAYFTTGNQEHLVDTANECLVEFTEPSILGAHFSAADNTDLHTRVK